MRRLMLSSLDTATVLGQLYYLVHAGIRTSDALSLLAEDEKDAGLRQLLSGMAQEADTGLELSEVMRNAGCFPAYVPEMVAVGERTGRTEETLQALSEEATARASLDRRLRSALVYPALLLIIMLAVIAVLLIYVLPIFNDVYAQLGGSLTGFAGGLMAFGKVLGRISPLLIAVFAVAAAFVVAFATSQAFRNAILSRWEKRHGDKGLTARIASGRFAQALSLCMSSGLNTEESVEMSAKLLAGTKSVKEHTDDCLARLTRGDSVTDALSESGLLPRAECRLLEAGQKGGASELAMQEIARRMTESANASLDDAVSRVEPAIVTISSVLVGIMLMAVMLPLVNIMSAIG